MARPCYRLHTGLAIDQWGVDVFSSNKNERGSGRVAGLWRRATLAVVLAALLAPLGGSSARAAVNLELVQGGFSAPIYLTHAGDARLFVVEKAGRIKIVGGGTFLDIAAQVDDEGERGLLGLAFHPSYATNGLFYVFYTRNSDGDIVISEWEVSGSPDVADPNSERIVLTIEHSSATNHNGGWIDFKGDNLYIATGDGGNTPDAAQNLNGLKGKILRLNPLDPPGAARVHNSNQQSIRGAERQRSRLVTRPAQSVALLARRNRGQAVVWRRRPEPARGDQPDQERQGQGLRLAQARRHAQLSIWHGLHQQLPSAADP